MRKKLMSNKQIISCLVLYFVGYAVIFNVALYFLSKFVENQATLIALQFCADVVILILLMKICKNLFADVGNSMSVSVFFEVPFYYISMIFASSMVLIPITFIANSETSVNQQAVEIMFEQNLLYSVFAVTLFAPIVEELIYRGVIYKSMRHKFNVAISVFVSSSVFALMHFVISLTSSDFSDIIFLPTYMVPSIFLCLFYEKHNNIFAPILLHLLNNSIGLIAIVLGMM